MEAYKRRYQYDDTRTSYVEGNTVRKLRVAPDIRREEEQYEIPQRRLKERSRKKALSGISFASLIVLTVAIITTVYVCVDYLMVQNKITVMNKQIVSMEKQITVLTKENDAAYEAINSAVDMDEVYRVAVEELGMVYPNKNEVITYESGSSDYVRQYEDIPE
jgi:cell division protein FtsL